MNDKLDLLITTINMFPEIIGCCLKHSDENMEHYEIGKNCDTHYIGEETYFKFDDMEIFILHMHEKNYFHIIVLTPLKFIEMEYSGAATGNWVRVYRLFEEIRIKTMPNVTIIKRQKLIDLDKKSMTLIEAYDALPSKNIRQLLSDKPTKNARKR